MRRSYFSIHFEPHIPHTLAFYDRSHSHKPDDQCLALLDRDVHLFADLCAAKEESSGHHAMIQSKLAFENVLIDEQT